MALGYINFIPFFANLEIAWPPGLTSTLGGHIVNEKDQPNLSDIIKQIPLIQLVIQQYIYYLQVTLCIYACAGRLKDLEFMELSTIYGRHCYSVHICIYIVIN